MDESPRCPICGVGVLQDMAYDMAPDGTIAQQPESREVDTYTCGHQVPGPRLETADPDRLSVERRSNEDTVDPSPAEVPPSDV